MSSGIYIGMRVRLWDDHRWGIIQDIRDRHVLIRFDDFDEWHPIEQVVPAEPIPYSLEDLEIKKTSSLSPPTAKKRPTRVEIDLHVQNLPDEAFPTFYHRGTPILPIQIEWARQCIKKYLHMDATIREVVFIHGRGEGRLRKELIRAVSNMGYEWEPAGVPYPPHVAIIVRRRSHVGRRR